MSVQGSDAKKIFLDAIEQCAPEEWPEFLDEACGGDRALRERVEVLLKRHGQFNEMLDGAGVLSTIALPALAELPGTQIGPYKLLEQIGEGGMGIVYVASQREPLRRKVALKIIKPGMDTREVVARFEAERQALALMDHPNIAKVFDAGATDAGRPYFAMELVKGTPITEYCDREQLSTRERLALFVTLCHGVQHAHQKGVIHRDLKPSNLLVEVHDVRPVPKIIDFGIAKALGQQLTEKTFHTAQSQMVGTPLYMSPEQAGQSCKDVDTRSDIYSLGVLLYELLTGHTPFEKDALRTAGFDEMRRIIREVEPPRPSARVSTLQAADLSTISERRHIEPRKLSQQLRGDLDWIVMKAMDKDRDRRYASASVLAADVQRYLDNEPVQARPPSLAHHAAKWVRRHRPLVWSSVAVLAIASVAGGTLFWTGYRRVAQLERDGGEHLAAATAFLGSGNYTAADRELADARGHLEAASYGTGPLADKVTDLTVAIAAKTQSIGDFEQFQELRHRIHSEMYALDRTILDQAQTHCRTALDLFGVFAAEPWKSQADFEILDTARQALLDEGAVELLFVWARLEMGKSEAQPAAERNAGYRRAIEALGKVEKSHPSITAVALWTADCWEAIGDQSAAAEARARAESLKPTSATDHYLLGEYHAQHGQQDQALANYWQALARQPDHYLSLLAAGVTLGELRKYESAETMLTGAIAMYPQITLGYVKRGASRLGQGKILLAQADFQEAVKLDPELAAALIRRACDFRENLELDKALADFDEAIRLDPKSAWAYAQRSLVYVTRGDLDKVITDCNAAIQLDPKYSLAYAFRACAYRGKGQLDKALADSNEAIRLDPTFSGGYFERGSDYCEKRELDKALADMNEALRLGPSLATNVLSSRANVYRCRGEYDKAMADCDEAIRLSPKNIWAYFQRAAIHEARGDVEKALAELSQAISLNQDIPWGYGYRARILQAQGEFDKALADYSEAIRLGPTAAGAYVERAGAYAAKGDSDKALADYSEAIRLAPSLASPYVGRAGVYITKRDFDQALVDLDEAIRLDPTAAGAYAQRSVVYVTRGDMDKVIADSNAAIQLDAKDSRAYVCRAAAYRAQGELDKALADSNEAIQLNPTFAWAYAERGESYARKGDSDKALADYSEAIRLEPGYGDAHGRRGIHYLERREFENAAADLDRAAELAPISYHYYKRRALAHFELKHFDKALESLAKAVELNPGDGSNLLWIDPDAVAKCPNEPLRQGLLELADKAVENSHGTPGVFRARGIVRLAFGRQEEALADFSKVIELEPKNPEAWAERARLHVDLGQWEKAIADYSKLLELQPEPTVVWYWRSLARLGGGQADDYRQDCGELLQRLGSTDSVNDAYHVAWTCALAPDATKDWATAVTLAEKAVQSDPKSATYLNTLGAVLYRAGRFDEALARLSEVEPLVQEPSEAIKSPPAYTWFFLAMTQQRLGHAEEAKPWLDKAVAWTDKILAEADQGTADLSWNRRLTLKLFRDEATTLLGVTPPVVEPAPAPAAKVDEAQEFPKSTPAPEAAKEEEPPK